MSIVVLCPSRARPDAAEALVASFRATAADPDSRLVFIVDVDDETASAYPDPIHVVDPPPGCMNAALAAGTAWALETFPTATVFGFVGDDHRFRTAGWDQVLRDFLAEHPGIGYADDLFQRANLPTMWFVSRPIVEVFGMGHPGMHHLWIDDYWKRLGDEANCLYYFHQLVIEHLHPAAGKAQWTEQYLRVNNQAMRDHDFGVFTDWVEHDLAADAETLRTLVRQ